MKIVPKMWGHEEWIEVNDTYAVKKLHLKQNCRTSLQYHEKKRETFYIISGRLKFTVGNEQNSLQEVILTSGAVCTLEPGKIHRMEALEDSEYLECSTTELDDVIRLADDFGRV